MYNENIHRAEEKCQLEYKDQLEYKENKMSDGNFLFWLIIKLQKLQFLDLEDNHLTNVTEEVGLLKNLEVLFLDSNFLTSLPENITNLKNLIGARLLRAPIFLSSHRIHMSECQLQP